MLDIRHGEPVLDLEGAHWPYVGFEAVLRAGFRKKERYASPFRNQVWMTHIVLNKRRHKCR